MYSKKELKKYSEAVTTIKSITRVYEEAAARRIKLIQRSAESVNEFIGSVSDTYVNTKLALLANEQQKKNGRKNILAKSFRSFNRKQVIIMVASHENYYGNLIPSIFRLWKDKMEATGADGIILGNTGKRLLDKTTFRPKNLAVLDLDDAKPDWKIVYQVGVSVSHYEKITVFCGKYKTVLNQIPEKSEISNTITIGQIQNIKHYLIETRADEILDYMERETIHAQLQLKIYQAQIARYAARIKILEIGQVAEKMSQVIGDLNKSRVKVHKNLNNKKQLQLYTGVNLWGENDN